MKLFLEKPVIDLAVMRLLLLLLLLFIIINKVLIKVTLDKVVAGALYIVICG